MKKIYFRNLCFFTNKKLNNNSDILFVLPGLASKAEEYVYFFKIKKRNLQILILDFFFFKNLSNSNGIDYLLNVSRQISIFLKSKNIKKFDFYAHSMSSIIPILLCKFFVKKRKLSNFINNEGNLVPSDCSFITQKTISYDHNFFKRDGYLNLIKKTKSANNVEIKDWSKNLRDYDANNFYNFCKSTYYWSNKINLLSYFKLFFKKKIYLYGEKSKNPIVLRKLFGCKMMQICNSNHFSHIYNKSFYNRSLLKLLI